MTAKAAGWWESVLPNITLPRVFQKEPTEICHCSCALQR